VRLISSPTFICLGDTYSNEATPKMPFVDADGERVEKGEEATDKRTVTVTNDGNQTLVTMASLISVNDAKADFANPGNVGDGDGIAAIDESAGDQNQVGITLVANGGGTDLDVRVEADGY
jgi:hypothetical protein